MNPQYAPQQPFGGPPKGFPMNRSSPGSVPPPQSQGFQNVPLGPQKIGPTQQLSDPSTYIPTSPMNPPVSTSTNVGPAGGQFPPNMGPPNPNLRKQIPAGQLPPGQEQKLPPAQFMPPAATKPDLKPQNGPPQFMNGPPQFQNGPPQYLNGAGFGPLPFTGQLQPPAGGPAKPLGPNMPPTSNFHQSGPDPNQPPKSGQSLTPDQFGPTGPAQNQSSRSGQPPIPAQSNLPGQPPMPAQSNLPGQPPIQPPLQGQNSHQSSFPPQNTNQNSNQAPFPVQPQPVPQPPSQIQRPQGNEPQFSLGNIPPPQRGQQLPPGQPLQSGQPLRSRAPLSQPPISGQPPQPSQSGQPPQPSQSGQPPLSGQPSQGMNQPPLPGQTIARGQPPLPGQPQGMNQPPLPGQTIPRGPVQSHLNQPPMPGQPPFPIQPHLNQPPMPGQPPLPGQAYNAPQFGQPHMPLAPGQFNQPPLPGQPPMPGQPPQNHFQGPNQLSNQMQGMSLSGPGRYPSGPMKAPMNGESGSSPMPPLPNQQYMNGQQVRGPPGPGYPPMPGQQPVAGPGAYPQPGYQPPQQIKRLDPDQMPSPIQVTQDDQTNRSGVFCTNQKGLVPPLVTTNFIVQDQGNASPRFIRSTMYSVPISQDIMKQTSVPFSLVISPMARTMDQEYPPPIVDFGELGPVRCVRCKAYMCPFMQFIDSGRRFQCLFCKATTDVPTEYFQHLDHTGQRLDRYERPELVLGAYEFIATTDYCRNNTFPKPPAIIFVIDVSYNNIKSGLVNLLCSQVKEIIQNLPVDQGQEKSNMKVGFITYNSSVHFYNIKGSLAAPQMLIVGDTQEMFMPLLDGFLCTPEESGPVIDSLMQQIPEMFGDTRETETILLPAILAGLEALKASDCTGKLLVFHSTLPTAEAPGKLKNRDDRKLLATDKEKTILTPQTQAYNQLGQDCVGAGCSVDLFVFNNAYIDIATIGQVSRLTGGEVHKYTYFQADIDGERLIRDIITNISRPVAFDSIMRVRTSTGVRPTDFYGHFFMSNTTDMELAAIDCDKAVAIEIKHDDKLSEEEGVYVQAALLYTSCSGQRRLRVINLSLKTCSQMADLYRSCDCDTIINYISKQATFKLLDHTPKAIKDNIVTRTAQMLATYRKNCASPSSAGQLILPECMKLLPLYVNCLLKSDALSGGSEMTIDDRSFVMQQVLIMDIPTSVNYFYPRLIPLHDLDASKELVEVPPPIRCTVDKMNEQGVYLLENGIHMFLWIGLGASPDFIQKVFGVPSAIQVDIERVALPELDNQLSLAVRTIIEEIRVQRHRCMRLTIVRQREKLEPVFKHFLAEDRGTDGSSSYVDFLIHMHKEIRALLS